MPTSNNTASENREKLQTFLQWTEKIMHILTAYRVAATAKGKSPDIEEVFDNLLLTTGLQNMDNSVIQDLDMVKRKLNMIHAVEGPRPKAIIRLPFGRYLLTCQVCGISWMREKRATFPQRCVHAERHERWWVPPGEEAGEGPPMPDEQEK